MSVESVARVLNLADPRLSPTAKLVLIGIANHDGDGGSWPKVDTLARYANVSERQARRLVRTLEDLGYVETFAQEGGTARTRSDRRPNRYVIDFDGGTPATPREDDDGGTPTSPRDDQRGDTQGTDGGTQDVRRTIHEPSCSSSPTVRDSSTTDSSLVLQEQSDCHSVTPVPAEGRLGSVPTFDDFWALYPRKTGKRAAEAAWLRALNRSCATRILEGLAERRAWWLAAETAPEFIPHPATWLNQDRWHDELGPLPSGGRLSPQSLARRHIEREYAEQGLQIPTRAQIEAWQAEDPDFGRRPPPPPAAERRPLPALGAGR